MVGHVCFRDKRTRLGDDATSAPETHSGHLGTEIPAVRRSSGARVLSFSRRHSRGFGSAPPRFRTIQVWPKDLLTLLRQAERAADRPHGPSPADLAPPVDDRGRNSPCRHRAARVHHAPRRRGCLAAELMTEHVIVTDADGIRTIRMNRPDKKNALTLAMYEAMTAALESANTDDCVHCVLIA